ncbi:MAG: hypothetical protein KJ871_01160 [Alphaproteobacteria bacterium]|nr:hypothetical protein [Alphaproteobacteria bacterium]MBU2085692.1 hypothetical protein [Alphaproteobacteria bacterium]MBU2141623.1 hypothetical protein [Alphaproteobacteria bacterium]MBU2197587.1 hypothetical protein [Alphaproteobacteria bacterium]
MVIADVSSALLAARASWHGPSHKARGVYGVFLAEGVTIPGLATADNGLLYIGRNATGLSHLDHFAAKPDGKQPSSARRSLSALLQDELSLDVAVTTLWDDGFSFRLSGASEARLSAWMAKALLVARLPLSGDTTGVHSLLVRALEPPLNLAGWRNAQRNHILAMRRACAYGAHADLT